MGKENDYKIQELPEAVIEQIQKFIDQRNENTFKLGQIELEKKELEKQAEQTHKQQKKLLKEERRFRKEFEILYGNGTIDIDQGVFIPNKE